MRSFSSFDLSTLPPFKKVSALAANCCCGTSVEPKSIGKHCWPNIARNAFVLVAAKKNRNRLIQAGNGNDLTVTAFAASAARGTQTQAGLGNATAAKAGTLKSIFRRNTASAHAASTASVYPVNGQSRVTNAGARCLKQSSGRPLGKREMPIDVFVGVVLPRCAATGPAASV